ncbi:MAG: hypothetical protein JW892_04775 [Anaerolineae bacterium]|nr:hypothetical protein [Anaerolineae bacterium]
MKTLQKISALVMVVVLFMAALPVSAASVIPEPYTSNLNCAYFGFTDELKFENLVTQTVAYGEHGYFTLTMLDSYTISWSATDIVYVVLVKAGNGGNLYDYRPDGTFSDTELTTPGQNAISHVSVCYNDNPAIETGDAPDSTNHYGWNMTAYFKNDGTTVVAQGNFPTVSDSSLGAPLGMCHYVAPDGAYLGAGRSAERDADLLADADGITNLIPTGNVSNADSDDGLDLPPYWYSGVPATITYTVSVPASGVAGTRYVNLWFDWNRDGDWGDASVPCDESRSTAGEYTVVNQAVTVNPGQSIVIKRTIIPCNPPSLAETFGIDDYEEAPIWVRITLSEVPVTGAQVDGSGAGYCYAEGETEDWYGTFLNPSAVDLARFEATAQDDGILIEWETATEIDNLGFNLYRSTAADGTYVKLNEELIPTQVPGAVFGAAYTWLDEGVAPGVTYFYKIEDVDIEGKATLHGPVQATALSTGPSAVSLTSFAAGGGGGVWLPLALSAMALLGGLKRRK